nr:unnamed protein product [Naegleria fowleri]
MAEQSQQQLPSMNEQSGENQTTSSFKKKAVERGWLSPDNTNGMDALARVEFLNQIPGEKQVKFVPCIKGVLSNAVHKMAIQMTQQQEEILTESMKELSAASLIQQSGSKALLMSSHHHGTHEQDNKSGGSIFTSLSNSSDFDPNMIGFEALKNKLTRGSSIITKDVHDLFLKRIPPWMFVPPHYHWKIRLHGDRGTGKTTVQRSLCRMNTNIDQHRNYHSDTMGTVSTTTLIPIKCIDSVKWVELEIVDVGDMSATTNPFYNSYQVNEYHAHLVLFSMGHYQSFRNTKNKLKLLKKQTNNIIVVATKADAFQNFQVTDNDIAELEKEFQLPPVRLINSHAQFGSSNSTYILVEDLADMLIA